MRSIITKDTEHCFLCGRCDEPLDEHHIFGGAFRKASEKYGLKVNLCHNRCHIYGRDSVHKNAEVSRKLKALAQRIAMVYYGWDIPEFIEKFGKNFD